MNRETDTVFLQTVGKFIAAQVQLAVAPLIEKIKEQDKIIEELKVQKIEDNNLFFDRLLSVEKGIDVIKTWPKAEVTKTDLDFVIASIPAIPQVINGKDGSDGKDGKDGKDADPINYSVLLDFARSMIEEEIKKFSIKDGVDGKDGAPGKDGKDAEAINYDDINEAIWNYMEKQIQKIPVPKDGRDGKDGLDGKDGRDGKDGADVVAAFRDSDKHLILTLSNGVVKDIGQIHGEPGKDGAPGTDGAPGRDGLGIKQLAVEYDGERTFTFKHVCEDGTVEVRCFTIPATIYRGIWREGKYQRGDMVTKGGSGFVALADTDTVPETKDCDWQLFVKRGRDGKEGDKGDPGAIGKPGRDGRDLTQMAFDGAKY